MYAITIPSIAETDVVPGFGVWVGVKAEVGDGVAEKVAV
jgi:hypothetical protein